MLKPHLKFLHTVSLSLYPLRFWVEMGQLQWLFSLRLVQIWISMNFSCDADKNGILSCFVLRRQSSGVIIGWKVRVEFSPIIWDVSLSIAQTKRLCFYYVTTSTPPKKIKAGKVNRKRLYLLNKYRSMSCNGQAILLELSHEKLQNISNKHSNVRSIISSMRDSVSSGYPNTEKRVENTTRSEVLLTKSEAFR